MTDTPPKLLKVAQVAEAISMSYSGVLAAINRGEIKATRIGRRLLIPETEITRLITEATWRNE